MGAIALLLLTLSSCTTEPPQSANGQSTAEEILQSALAEADSQDLCGEFFQPEFAAAESQVYPSEDSTLVEIACTLTAYQGVYAYAASFPDGQLQPLALDVFHADGTGQFVRTRESTLAGLTTFEPGSSTLTVLSKARGLADCGSWAEYRWTGSQLELVEFRYQVCDASEELIDPADYPQIYP